MFFRFILLLLAGLRPRILKIMRKEWIVYINDKPATMSFDKSLVYFKIGFLSDIHLSFDAAGLIKHLHCSYLNDNRM